MGLIKLIEKLFFQSRRFRRGHVAKLAKFLREKIGHVSAHAFNGPCEQKKKLVPLSKMRWREYSALLTLKCCLGNNLF